MGFDPVTLSEFLEQRAIETPRKAIIDVFDASLLAQLGIANPPRSAGGRLQRLAPRDLRGSH